MTERMAWWRGTKMVNSRQIWTSQTGKTESRAVFRITTRQETVSRMVKPVAGIIDDTGRRTVSSVEKKRTKRTNAGTRSGYSGESQPQPSSQSSGASPIRNEDQGGRPPDFDALSLPLRGSVVPAARLLMCTFCTCTPASHFSFVKLTLPTPWKIGGCGRGASDHSVAL